MAKGKYEPAGVISMNNYSNRLEHPVKADETVILNRYIYLIIQSLEGDD